jgi:hypothetical protein
MSDDRSARFPIGFDESVVHPALYFSTRRPDARGEGVLWWSESIAPQVIEEVLGLIARRRLEIATVVIAGLSEYPLRECEWPRWLCRLACRAGAPRLVVDTSDLTHGQVRRLVQGTRRQIALRCREQGVVELLRSGLRLLMKNAG